MAITALQTDKTENGASSAVEVTGPFMIIVPKNSVFNGAYVEIELATSDTSNEFEIPDPGAKITKPGSVYFNAVGVNFVRSVQYDSNFDTSISVDANQ